MENADIGVAVEPRKKLPNRWGRAIQNVGRRGTPQPSWLLWAAIWARTERHWRQGDSTKAVGIQCNLGSLDLWVDCVVEG